jgi:hypothetical protein
MNEHEIVRIAAAMHAARPDWNAASVATLIRKNLADRPRRDVFVALAWVASEPSSSTPARVLEAGPWWKAAGAGDTFTTGHQHVAKVYGFTEGDPREVCSECGMHRHECVRRSATNGHTFLSRVAATAAHQHTEECIEFCKRAGLATDEGEAS